MRASSRAGRRRRGFSLIELTATAFLVVAAMTLTVTSLGWTAAERGRVDRRQVAAREAGNALERASALDWGRLSGGPIELSPEARKSLPEGVLTIDVAEATPGLKRVRVEVSWRDGPGTRNVRVAAWLARREGGRP